MVGESKGGEAGGVGGTGIPVVDGDVLSRSVPIVRDWGKSVSHLIEDVALATVGGACGCGCGGRS